MYARFLAASYLFPLLLTAQGPDVARVPSSARSTALGHASVAFAQSEGGRGSNPALLALHRKGTLSAGYSRIEVTDVAETRVGASHGWRGKSAFALDLRHREVRNLIEDPQLADESGLRISDWAVRSSVGLSVTSWLFMGTAAERLASSVFGTRGSGWSFSIGTLLNPVHRVSVGLSAVRLGSDYRWRDMDGGQSLTPLGRALHTGIVLRPVTRSSLTLTLLADGEFGADRRVPYRAWKGGSELRIARLLYLRGGMLFERPYDQFERSSSAGIGVAFKKLELDIAQDRIGAEVGQRMVVDLTWRP